MIYQSWQWHWDDLSEFFKYQPEIRKAIYTTNAVESLNFSLHIDVLLEEISRFKI
jgi:transposase-like protein